MPISLNVTLNNVLVHIKRKKSDANNERNKLFEQKCNEK